MIASCKCTDFEPTSGKTIQLESKYKLSDERADEVIAASHKNYARKYEEPEIKKPTKKQSTQKATKAVTKTTAKTDSKSSDKLKGRSIGKN